MNKLQSLIYNAGERLVPYVSHDEAELVRHRSSYAFFHAVISADLIRQAGDDNKFRIVDLGFGSGYGCALLASLPGTLITGVDNRPECEIFARQYYQRPNVNYLIKDLRIFIPEAEPFDYVVSRGVLEHVPDGLSLIKHIKYRRRVMIDVPYDEAPGNEHHILTGIKEDAFSDFANCELFYEDLEGRIFDQDRRPEKSNMIMVVMSSPDLPKVQSLFAYPLPPVRDTKLEMLSASNASGTRHYFDSAGELLAAVEKVIRETDVVMDIGCGIAPMNYFRPKLHLMVEPWREYSDILTYRHFGDKSVIIIRSGALEALRQLGDNSVDSIFLLDVIEHLEKDEGREVIIQSERVAREQVVIFTPLGFMPQHMEGGQLDGWGLSGRTVQEHRSGWEPEDFGAAWSLYICTEFHTVDFKGEQLNQAYGAFYAVRNFEGKTISVPEKASDFRRPLPSELEVQRLQGELHGHQIAHQIAQDALQGEHDALRREYNALQSEYHALVHSRGMRMVRLLRKILGFIGK